MSLKWSDIYFKTIQSGEDRELKVLVSAGRDVDGNIKSLVSHLRWYFMGKPTKQGVSFNTRLLSLIWDRNEDHHNCDGWKDETLDQKISVSFNYPSVTIGVCRNQNPSVVTMDYDAFRRFVIMIPCLRFIINAVYTQDKMKIVEQVLSVLLTHGHKGDVDGQYLILKYETLFDKVNVVVSTLGLPEPLISTIMSPEFVNACKSQVKGGEEALLKSLKVMPITENELYID